MDETQSAVKPEQKPRNKLGHPVDRGAAAVVDLTVSGFLSSAFLAPFQRSFLIAKYTDDLARSFDLILLNILCFFVINFIYVLVSTKLSGATLGKRAFKLEVAPAWDTDKKPSLKTLAHRQLLWWFDVLTLVPLLKLFEDPRRRPFHDRACDTVVRSTSDRGVGEPHPVEVKLAQLLGVSFFLVLLIACLAVSPRVMNLADQARAHLSVGDAETLSCERVDEVIDDWQGNSRPEARLEAALSLYTVGHIDEACLDEEAVASFSEKGTLDQAYLAKAFVTSEQPELSDAYLKKVCEINAKGTSCLASQLLSFLSDHNFDEADEILSRVTHLDDPFLKLWAIKHYEKTEAYEKTLTLLDQLSAYKPLNSFLSSHRVIALWSLKKKSEARAAFSTALPSLDGERAVNLAAWMCVKELEGECPTTLPQSCSLVSKSANSDFVSTNQTVFALAYLKSEECEKDGDFTQTRESLATMTQPDVLLLLKVKETLKDKKTRLAKAQLIDLIHSTSQAYLKQEALARLVNLAQTQKELTSIEHRWLAQEEETARGGDAATTDAMLFRNTWVERKVFERYIKLGSFREAARIGERLLKAEPQDEGLRKKVVVAAFRAGELKNAWDLNGSSLTERAPANVESDYQKITKALQKKFGRP